MPDALTDTDCVDLEVLARDAHPPRPDLAEKLLLYRRTDPVMLVVAEIAAMRRESKAGLEAIEKTMGAGLSELRAEIHSLRHLDEATDAVPLALDQPPAVPPAPSTLRQDVVSFVREYPRGSAAFALIALAMVVGGPPSVTRLLDAALGPDSPASIVLPVPTPMPVPISMGLPISPQPEPD